METKKYYNFPSQDEVQKFQQLKGHQVATSLDPMWKLTIKEQIEDEMNRKVREALETPPHEKIIRIQKEALQKRKEKENLRDLNAHLNFNDRDRNKYSKRLSTTFTETNIHEDDYVEPGETKIKDRRSEIELSNKFEYWLKPRYQPQQFTSSGVLLKLHNDDSADDDSDEHMNLRTGFDAMQNFGTLTLREKELLFSTFTKEGFKECLRMGRLPDGSKLEALANGVYRDKFGIVRDKHGPFWPKEKGPLHPTPHHKRILLECDEPLLDPLSEKDSCNEKTVNHSQYNGVWKHSQIVFDSDFSPRNQRPQSRGENICPDLIFESRFESGNLRQARRTGQMEYELVLHNDLFTTRHTQWFYFRIQNMVKNVTYKFVIINLLKPSSLYMNGMRMLMYSDKNVNANSCGWFRTGHHIRYSRNITKLLCPLLSREIPYYQLDFQIEFPYADDVCYLAHCYPYTYSDLKNDLELHLSHHNATIRNDVLCETRLGNSCFVLTITDSTIPDEEKLGAVITARVHPGETNASWMMNGLIQFLSSNEEVAQQIRKRMVFKIVPMLNPDGVIIGNYRCSFAGRDLNRNYRLPREQSFPTIYHTKKLIESLKESCKDVALYCDLHGHSRKHNVFMYGCDSQYLNCADVNDIKPKLTVDTVEMFVKDRIFPWLMQRQRPSMFSFSECQFKIRKCKESTGRVVMWKEFNVADSYTLETTFSGSDFDSSSRRHFNTKDLESVGQSLMEALMSYTDIINDEKLDSEVRLAVLKTILKQLANKSKQMKSLLRILAVGKTTERDGQSLEKEIGDNNVASTEVDDETIIDSFLEHFNINDLDKLGDLNIDISDIEDNSSSSDSDSESQPEEIIEAEEKMSKIKRKKKKLKIASKDKSESMKKKNLLKSTSTRNLPVIKVENNSMKEKSMLEKAMKTSIPSFPKTSFNKTIPLFISKFNGRTNGGIPCFAEERLEERARRRSFASLKKDIEKALFKRSFEYDDSSFNINSDKKLVTFSTTNDDLMKQYRLLQKRSSDILKYRYSTSSIENEYVAEECLNIPNKENVTRSIQKPRISQQQLHEMSDTQSKHHLVFQTGNGAVFKSVTSDVSGATTKPIRSDFQPNITRKLVKISSQKMFKIKNETREDMPMTDYIKWLNKHYKKIFTQIEKH